MVRQDMQVVHYRAPPQIKEILARPAVASTPPLPVAHMRQGVLDRHALAQLRSPRPRLLLLAQLDEQTFVGMDVDAAPVRAGGAAHPQRTHGADRGGEVDRAARLE